MIISIRRIFNHKNRTKTSYNKQSKMAFTQKIVSLVVLLVVVFAISCQCSPTNSSRKGVPPASLNNPTRVSTNSPSVRVNSTAVHHRTQRSPSGDFNNFKTSNRTSHSAEESDEETSGGKTQQFQIFQRPVPAGDSGETIRTGSNPTRNSTHGAGASAGGANGNRPHILVGSGAVVN